MSTRLSVNINDEVATTLRSLAEEHDTTVTEIIRRSVSVYHFFREQLEAGKQIRLDGPTGYDWVQLP